MSSVGTQARRGLRSGLSRALVTTQLLDEATKLFARQSYEQTTLQDVADAMGISRSALYHYVSSKEDLLVMLVEQVSEGLAEVLQTLGARSDLTATQKLRDVVALLVRQRAEHPEQFRILDRSEAMLPAATGTAHSAAKRKVVGELTALIESGQRTGEFAASDPRVAAFGVLGMCNWVAWWFRPGGDVEEVVATIGTYAEKMLGARDDAAGSGDPKGLITEIRERLDLLERSSE